MVHSPRVSSFCQGCATPVGVGYLDPQESQYKLTAICPDRVHSQCPTMQSSTGTVLRRRDSRHHPAEVIAATIHKGVFDRG
jgi:hypothetical protein